MPTMQDISETIHAINVGTPDDLKRIQKRQHQRLKRLEEQRRELEAKKKVLGGNIFSRSLASMVSRIIPIYKGIIYLGAGLLFVEVVFLVAALRGFSQRPKAADSDASVAALVAIMVTLSFMALPALPLVYVFQRTSLRPDIQNERKELEIQIAENDDETKIAQRFHDAATERLQQIAKRQRIIS